MSSFRAEHWLEQCFQSNQIKKLKICPKTCFNIFYVVKGSGEIPGGRQAWCSAAGGSEVAKDDELLHFSLL